LTVNQRNDIILTTTPTAGDRASSSSRSLYFPQFADGGGYTTTLILLNTSNSEETGHIRVLDDEGAPFTVNQLGGSEGSLFSYSIPPSGTFRLQTDGSPGTARSGWVTVIPDGGTSSPAGAGIYSLSQGGILVTETGVPAATPTTHARIYVDESLNHATGLALAGPGDSSIDVTLRAFGMDGASPAGQGAASMNLTAYGHRAGFVSDLVSELPTDFRGVLDISSSSPVVAVTLRTLTNSRGDFLVTTFPIADTLQQAPSPIVFPQIANGGGYVTEFILISTTGGATKATLCFFGDDGMPWAVAE
ncbi:MAG: hypothetical protein P8020_21595, partial [Acidobacteriota bacterium]